VLLPPPLPPRLFSPPFCHFPCFFSAFFETFFPEEELEDDDDEEEESGGETALAAVGFAHNFFLLFDFALFLKNTVFGETHIVRNDNKEEVIFVFTRVLKVVEKERMLLEV
jgi:hypothetical protein